MTYHFEKTIGEITLRYDLTFDATCPVECRRFENLRAEWESRPAPAVPRIGDAARAKLAEMEARTSSPDAWDERNSRRHS